ncbi:MAG: hypothetical protein HZB43_11050 [candidate division Zixibacteria bacterium]|nr:hypothetical protein [candidate division Zixibacteria bacterium]
MKSHLMRGLVVALLAIPLLLIASCSKKDSGTNPDNSGAPVLTVPPFGQTVNFVGNDASIQSAKAKVQSQIDLVAPWLVTPKAIATALNAGQWEAKVNGCWSKSSAQSNCTTAFKMCDSTAGTYEWSRTRNGNCSGVDHANWVDADGSRNADGGTGSIRAFKNNSTDVDSVWAWTTSGDQNTKNWKVYAGAEAPGNLVAQLQWTKGAGNANNWTFQQLGSFTLAAGASSVTAAKWTLTASSDAKTGTMDIYSWSAGSSAGAQSFWRSDHIAWNPDSSGTWVEYGEQGNVVTEHNWPQTGPDISFPTVGHDIVFDTTTQCAKDAYQIAQLGISSVQGWVTQGRDYFGYLDSLDQGGPVDGCWTWSGASGEGCTAEFKVCQEGSDYHWTWKLNGSCSGSFSKARSALMEKQDQSRSIIRTRRTSYIKPCGRPRQTVPSM